MSQPTPGLQRRDTFGSLVHKMTQGRTLAVKYASLMVQKLRRPVSSQARTNGHELPEVRQTSPTEDEEAIQDVNWDQVQSLISTAGTKHVLVYFYLNTVQTFPKMPGNFSEQTVQEECWHLSTSHNLCRSAKNHPGQVQHRTDSRSI